MLQDYFLLVRRIGGISLSIEQFWELDTWTTAVLLNFEKQIIQEEKDHYDELEGNQKYTYEHKDNAPEMNELVNNMMSEWDD